MKKLFYCLAAIVLASLSACTNEELDSPKSDNSDEVTVSFSVQNPDGVKSRAWDSGEYAKKLYWQVLTTNNYYIAESGETEFDENSLTTNVNITLLKGYEYTILFWAQNEDAPYTWKKYYVTADYSDVKANDETLDAFYAKLTLKVTKETEAQTVTLTRPFANITILTSYDDYTAAMAAKPYSGYLPIYTQFTVKNVYNTFNLLSEDVAGDTQTVTYAYNNGFSEGGKVYGIGGQSYVQIGRIITLTKPTGDVVDFDFSFGYNGSSGVILPSDPVTISNIPVKANQKTFIYGDFYTKTTSYEVTIDPTYTQTLLPDGDGLTGIYKELYKGGTVSLTDDTELNSADIKLSDTPVTLDLNGNTLTINQPLYSVNLDSGADLTFTNGNLKCVGLTGANAEFVVQNGAKLTLDGVTYKGSGCPFYVRGDATSLTVKNSTVETEGYYTLATNASNSTNWNVIITLEKSTFKSSHGLMINVPSTLNITDCDLEGDYIALLVRGGNATVKDSRIKLNAEELNTTWDERWGQGAEVARAAVTIGNNGSTAYSYESNVEITGTTITAAGTGCRALYVWPDASKNTNLTLSGNTYVGEIWVNTNNLVINVYPDGWKDITPSSSDTE